VDYSRGDLVSALSRFKESLKLSTDIGNAKVEIQSRLFLGYIYSTSGEIVAAKKQFNASLLRSRDIGNRLYEALCLTAIGTALSAIGDEEAAITKHREAMEMFRVIGDTQSEAVSLNGIGQAYQNLNENRAALLHYERALRLFQDNGNMDLASAVLYQIAKVYDSAGDARQAETLYRRAIRVSRFARKKRILIYALKDLAALHISKGRKPIALVEFWKALRFYESIGDRRGQTLALNNIGDLHFAAGQQSRALLYYKRALPLSKHAADRSLEVSTLYKIATAEKILGLWQESLSTVGESIKLIEDLRANVASPDFRLSYFSNQRRQYEFYIDLLMQEQPGMDWSEKALLASENARARSLREMIAEVGGYKQQALKPEITKRRRELEELLGAAGENQPDLSQTNHVAARVELLRTEYKELQAQQSRPPVDLLTQPKGLSIAQMQAELKDGNTLLLEYALGNERSYVWSLSGSSLNSYTLPNRMTLERAARELYSLLTARQGFNSRLQSNYHDRVNAADAQYFQKAIALSRMLLGPVAHELGNKRLIIVSDGMLQHVPFDALPLPDSEKDPVNNPADAPLVISRHEVVNLPSIATLAAIRSHRREPSASKDIVALLADPVFSLSDERVTANMTELVPSSSIIPAVFGGVAPKRPTASLVRLIHTSGEVESIAAIAPGNTWIAKGFAANREMVLSDRLREYKIVHFATHGVINTEHPELSGLVLSMLKPDGSRANGYLQLHDIYNLRLSADLTVLSACETALGKDVNGEGLIGLTRAFMNAGSRSVVASLWKVDDRATATLMKHFYAKMLNEGLAPAAALRSAKEIVRQEPAWRAPYYWAGFIIQGEYLESIPVQRDPGDVHAPLLALALLAIAAFIWIKCSRMPQMGRKHA
jgi:CHAT domain-containing protein